MGIEPSPVRKFLAAAISFGAAYILAANIKLSDPVVLVAVGIFALCGVVGLLGALSDFVSVGLNLWTVHRAMNPEPVFGVARFASRRDVRKAGLTDPGGLFLGKLGRDPLFFRGKSALLTVAPPRSGKGVSAVVPNLLHYQGSVFVTDPKGELAAMTAEHRENRFGQKVAIINPWGLHGMRQDRYNPLQPLIEMVTDPYLCRSAGDEVRRLALQLLPEPDRASSNAFFRNGSRRLLRALMLHFASSDNGRRCSLPEVWRTLTSPHRMRVTIDQMRGNDALDGVIADLGADLKVLMDEDPEHYEDFKEGALQAVDIYDPSGWLADTVSRSDFSLKELKEGRITIYLVIPQDELSAYGSWLGIMTRQAISAVSRSSAKGKALFMLDEFGSMGRIEGIAESLTGLPGLGVRVWMIVQSLKQLNEIYGPHVTNVILGATEVKQFFSVRQLEAQVLSAWLGQETVVTKGHNLGRFVGDMPTLNLGATGRPLMSAEEIVRMDERDELLFIQNLPPVLARRIDYRSVDPWRDWAGDNPTEAHPVRHLKREFSISYDRE